MARKQQSQDKFALFPLQRSTVTLLAAEPTLPLSHPLPELKYVHSAWGLGYITAQKPDTPESQEVQAIKAQGNTICVTCLEDGAAGYFMPDSLSVASIVDVSLWQTRQVQSHFLATIDALVEQLSLSA